MIICIQGYCLNDEAFVCRVSYHVSDQYGPLNSPSDCEWIVPGTIEE
jgi:hypothetical protein